MSGNGEKKAAIELIDVHKSFGQQPILKGVNLRVDEGTTTVIVGPSGMGKSVILKHMLGLIRPDSGQVLIYGRDLTKMATRELKKVRMDFGVLFQNAALFDSMTVYENVALPLRERTKMGTDEIREAVRAKLEMMDLHNIEEKFPAQISGGMRKRVGLARALMLDPRIVFFDEPTTGLDVHKSNEIYRLFYRTQEQFHYTAVIVSHDVPKIFKLSDKVALIHEGKLQPSLSPEDFQLSDDPAIRQFVETTMGPIYSSDREEPGYRETI
jgi:phospholipid/cholesterol/gamma-HCH transport system ATP-binding protein